MSLRICILETDVLRPELVDQYQGYGRMFEHLFTHQPIAAEFRVYNVMNGEYPDDDEVFDAYLVTGSKADSFGDDPWIARLKTFLLDRYKRGDKLLGVCFGHQLLALLLGGRSERAHQGWGVGTHRYVMAAKAPWMSPQVEELTLLISHQDQVTQLPENATVIASSDFCPYAAYHIGDQQHADLDGLAGDVADARQVFHLPRHVDLHVAKIRAHVLVDEGEGQALQLFADLDHRCHIAAQAQDVATQAVQAADIVFLQRTAEYVVFQLFDLAVNRLAHRLVVFSDEVEQCIQHEVFAVLEQQRPGLAALAYQGIGFGVAVAAGDDVAV
uniref:Glutamine amidotransferase type-1 domain-containing protein n=1 Tax=Steinernema glaseri TaxID=37863 RepID=A0A1I7YQE0_9BILA